MRWIARLFRRRTRGGFLPPKPWPAATEHSPEMADWIDSFDGPKD
jgi:hypothetical protein